MQWEILSIVKYIKLSLRLSSNAKLRRREALDVPEKLRFLDIANNTTKCFLKESCNNQKNLNMKNIGHIINGISNRIGGWGAMLYIIALFLCACDDHNHKANTTYEPSYNVHEPTYTPSTPSYNYSTFPSVQSQWVVTTRSPTPDDAYSEGYDEGYEQGKSDGRHGHDHGYGYDDSSSYYDYYETKYQEGYEEGYDEGYDEGHSEYEEAQEEEEEDEEED